MTQMRAWLPTYSPPSFLLVLKKPKEGFAALNPAPGPFAACQQSIRLGHLLYKG